LARLEVELLGDSRSLERAFARSEKAAAKFQRTIVRGAAAAGLGLGVADLVRGIESTVNAASNLNEQMSRTTVVFSSSSDEIKKWSETTATSMGLAQDQALEAVSTFGTLFTNIGTAPAESARLSKSLAVLGADLASFANTPVPDALAAIRSGLTGEIEPLRRYGAFLSEAAVQQEAFRVTGKKSTDELTTQDKVLARYRLIVRQTTLAQGDFTRTSGGLANQQRILTANIRNLQIALGEALIPKLTDTIKRMNEWLEKPENKKRVIDGWTSSVDALAAAFGGLAQAQQKRGETKRGLGPLGFILGGPVEAARNFTKFTQEMERSIDRLFGTTPKAEKTVSIWESVVLRFTRAFAGLQAGLHHTFSFTPKGTTGAGTAGQTERELARIAERTATNRNTWFDALTGRLFGRANDPTQLAAQINNYRRIAALIQQRLAITKDITRRLYLEDQLADIAINIRDRQQQIADQAAADAQTRQETKLGWLEFGLERAEATKKMSDDRGWLKKIEAYYKERIQHEGRKLELVSELWRTQQKIRDLNKKSDVDPLAGLVQVSTRRLTNMLAAGTGLDVHGRQVLGRNIAGAEIRPVYVGVNIDGREVGRAVTTDNARTGRRTSRQTSGYRG
jgi:hypothetical protein